MAGENNPRACGECSECCVVMRVKGVVDTGAEAYIMDKPAGLACSHQRCGGGCAVYAGRPKSCKDWSCMWQKGQVGTEADRPDKTGIVMQEVPIAPTMSGVRPLVVMNQSRAGSNSSAYGRVEARRQVNDGRIVLKDAGVPGIEGKKTIVHSVRTRIPGDFARDALMNDMPIYTVSTKK